MNKPLQIVVTGPECTGKTHLSSALAKRFGEPWVSEFAVEYLNGIDRPYTSGDLVKIAQGQLASIAQKEKQAVDLLVIDTGLEVIDIWHKDKLGVPPPVFQNLLHEWSPDLYLLCKPDIPYEPHPLREDPHRRDVLFEQYLQVLGSKPVVIIEGDFTKRTEKAARAIEALLRKQH